MFEVECSNLEDYTELEPAKEIGLIGKRREKRILEADENTTFSTQQYDVRQLNLLLEKAVTTNLEEGFLELCSICQSFLHTPYIKCAECDGLICLPCFAKGRENRNHRNDHSYTVFRDDLQLFDGDDILWTGRDEKLLLNSLQKHGYGNWEAIAKEFKGKFTNEECCNHYHNYYFGGIFEQRLGLSHEMHTYFPIRFPYLFKMRSIDPPRHDSTNSVQYEMMAGYRCARGEFDTPYDNSAESILTTILDSEKVEEDSHLVPNEWEKVEETLQCALIQAYNNRLRERYRRYKIMRQHGLILTNKTTQWFAQYLDIFGKSLGSSRFLVFMQISNPKKFDLLMESLKYFKDIESSIYKLYELRENGVKTLTGGSLYFKSKHNRQEEQKDRLKEGERLWHDWRRLIKNSEQLNSSFNLASGSNQNQRKKPGPLDILGLPGYSNLSKDERALCQNVRLVPQNYLDYKKILAAENVKIGHVRLNDARRLIKIDVNKTRQIYDFLVEKGHLNKPLPL